MVEGVERVAEREPLRLGCVLCGRRGEVAFSMGGAQIPRRTGHFSGVAICPECADRLTHAAPRVVGCEGAGSRETDHG